MSRPALVIAALACSHCALLGTYRNVKALDTIPRWAGTLELPLPEGKPTYVVLLTSDDSVTWRQYSSAVFFSPGSFELYCPPGPSRLFVFADLDEDFKWSVGEPSVDVAPQELVKGEVGVAGKVSLADHGPPPPGLLDLAAPSLSEELIRVRRGDLAQLHEDRFSAEAGLLGYWQPIDFVQRYGFGVSFLEPYDPKKVPVLFVHGAQGTPAHFRALIASLDRTRFQPWVYAYPSGLRLELAGRTLARITEELEVKYRFERLLVVAHSMGGLVARDFVSRVSGRKTNDYVKLLVTLSTPFAGHEGAQSGVDRSPVVLPVWVDMALGSPFLAAVKRPIAPPHHLFFSYLGGGTIGDSPSDGAVSMRSMLQPEVQSAAAVVRGFAATHMSILQSPALIEAVNRSLAAFAPP